jgi:4-hydroxy-tetrahydrodipicolinate synthase
MSTEKPSLFEGINVPIITPFNKDESIDYDGLRRNLDFLIESGVHGIVTGGSSGEFFMLSDDERLLLHEKVLEHVNGRIPVYAGTGGNTVRDALRFTRHAKDFGAQGALVIPPYFIPPVTDEIKIYYQEITEAVDLPICIYNLPDRAGVNLAPIAETLSQLPNVLAWKESTANLMQMAEVIRASNGRLKVLMGHDLLALPALVMGAKGVLSPMPNLFGKRFVEIYTLFKAGNIGEARKRQYELYRFRSNYKFGTFPWVLKEAMNLAGLCGGYPRRPLQSLKKADRDHLAAELVALKVISNAYTSN